MHLIPHLLDNHRLDSDKQIVMIGTALNGRGGISSVAATYAAAGLFDDGQITYLESHCDVSKLAKLKAFVGSMVRLWILLLRGKADLVHVHTASGLSFWRKSLFAWSALLWRKPMLLHIHSGMFDQFVLQHGWLLTVFVRATLSRACRVIVLSESWIEKLSPICPEARWSVLVNPVNIYPAPLRIDKNIESNIEILFLGRITRLKGVFDLVRAFAAIHQAAPCLRLVLAGEGECYHVMQMARDLGVADKIQMTGWIGGVKKAEWLDRCEIFALPSYIEALPVSMLEAMAARQAVVVSRVGSVPEVLGKGHGLMVPAGGVDELANALLTLANNSSLRRQIANAGRELVENHYAATIVCARLRELYKECLLKNRKYLGNESHL